MANWKISLPARIQEDHSFHRQNKSGKGKKMPENPSGERKDPEKYKIRLFSRKSHLN
jgi:hypothetical protein